MKKIIAILLITAMLICGCGKADKATEAESTEAAGTETTDGTAEPTEAPTDAPTEPSSEATEPSETPTEPSSEEPVDPEPDPYAEIKYYPFPLLDMTVAEIEAEYGELELSQYSEVPVQQYYLESAEVYLEFVVDRGTIDLPKDKIPFALYKTSGSIYPGIEIGGPAADISGLVWSEYGHSWKDLCEKPVKLSITFSFNSELMDDYHGQVWFDIPDELYDLIRTGSFLFDDFADDIKSNKSNTPVECVFIKKSDSIFPYL